MRGYVICRDKAGTMSSCSGGWRSVTLVLAFLYLCAIQFGNVSADYVLQVQLDSYTNPGNTLADESCCNGSCTTPCDTRLCLCIREANTAHDDTSCTIFVKGGLSVSTGSKGLNVHVDGPWTGAVQVFITALEDDTNSLIDNIFIEVTLKENDPLTQVQTYNGTNGVAMVEIGFDANCAVGFVGPDCTTCEDGLNGPHCMCMDTDDATGHYTCNQDGSIICLTGYQDETTDCTTCVPADGCSPVGGYCEAPGECQCHPGYEGETCSDEGPSVPEGETVTASGPTAEAVTTSGPTAEAITTPALEAANPATDNGDGDDLLPIIVGVVVGVITLAVFVVIVVVAVVVYRRRKRRNLPKRVRRNIYTNTTPKIQSSDSQSDELYAVVQRDIHGKKSSFTYRTFELDGGKTGKKARGNNWFEEPSADATIVANPTAEGLYAEISEVKKEVNGAQGNNWFEEPSADATIVANPTAEGLYAEISEVKKEAKGVQYADIQHEEATSQSAPDERDKVIYSEVQFDKHNQASPDDDGDDDGDDSASSCSDESAQL